MFFTQEDYLKIQQWLQRNSVKDTEFQEADIPLNGNEVITLVQNGHNKKVHLEDLVKQMFSIGIADFVNVSSLHDKYNITLNEAIQLVPHKSRKKGQVITFCNTDNVWKIYQFTGVKNQWNILDLWNDLFDWTTILDVNFGPDEEDITANKSEDNIKLSFKDRVYEPDSHSGLGYKILRKNIVTYNDPTQGELTKNILVQDKVVQSNTIYEIRYDFDLNNQTINIPENSVLQYKGGSLNNGKIVYNNTIIEGIERLNNVTTEGDYTYPYTGDETNPDEQLAPTLAQLKKLSTEVTNIADDEDLTKIYDSEKGQEVLQLKDRQYVQGSNSGMGYVILRKNNSFKEHVTKANTIYEIRYDFDLGGEEVDIPENCVLKFEGGSLENGIIVGNSSYIEGIPYCIKSIILQGTFSNIVKLSWLGIIGKDINNAERFNNLNNHSVNIFELDSSIYMKHGDIEIPKGVSILGNSHNIIFECESANNSLFILSQGCKLKDVSILANSLSYDKNILLADTRINQCHTFSLENVNISGVWNEDVNYKATGLKIIASNENDNLPTSNYITGCFYNRLRMTWLEVGIDISCINVNRNDTTDFAWLNEQYFNSVYISSTDYGIITEYIDEGTNNPANSVGPLYFHQTEYQALKQDSKMFNHKGEWNLILNTGFCWDCDYKGEINNGGTVNAHMLYGCYKDDKLEDEDSLGKYQTIDSVKIYEGCKYHKGIENLVTSTRYRTNSYSTYYDSPYWDLGALGEKGFGLSTRFLSKKIINNETYEFLEETKTAGPSFMQKLSASPGLTYSIYGKRYGISNDVILLHHSRDSATNIIDSYGVSERYSFGISKYINKDKIIEGRVILKFNIDAKEANYSQYKDKYPNGIRVAEVDPMLTLSGYDIISDRYSVVGDDLCVSFKAKKINESSWIYYAFSTVYQKYFSSNEYSIGNEKEVLLNLSKERYITTAELLIDREYYDCRDTSNRPVLTTEDGGFQFFDTTLHKPIYWTGYQWVDATGAEVV